MELETRMIKPIVRVGNSAGVILPIEWLNGKARIELISRPLDIKNEIVQILDAYLEDIIGIYLVGSYARNEQNSESDADVLVITNKTNKKIEKGKYSIILISKEKLEKELKKNILPLLPMIIEAKPLLNKDLIENYKNIRLNANNLKAYLEITKSALKVNRAAIDLNKETKENCTDATAYSLILSLRSAYIVDCLKNDKLWSNKEFIRLIKNLSGSLKAYGGYLRVKNNLKLREELQIEEAENIYDYIHTKLIEQEKWAKREK